MWNIARCSFVSRGSCILRSYKVCNNGERNMNILRKSGLDSSFQVISQQNRRWKVTVTKTLANDSPPKGDDDTSTKSSSSAEAASNTVTAAKTTTKTTTIRTSTATIKAKMGISSKTRKTLRLPDQKKEEELMRIQQELRVHHKHGNYDAAMKCAQKYLDETQDHFGKEHPATASAYNNLGLLHKLIGNLNDARKMYREALRIYGRVVGKDHASYASALHNMGALNQIQVHIDEGLTGIQRLQLSDKATEYLSEAWKIRQDELGDEHPLTLSSRSQYGAALAAQILQNSHQKQSKTTMMTKQSQSLETSKWTQRKWEAAEDHLRHALQTAIDQPRGKKITTTTTLETDTDTIESEQAATTIADSNSQSSSSPLIQTLSAAAAAQNLAVILKMRGTEISDQDDSNNNNEPTEEEEEEVNFRIIDEGRVTEAKQLYEQALHVRQELLHVGHPDLVATKYSLAELLTALGQKEAANALRADIVDMYNVEEKEESDLANLKDENFIVSTSETMVTNTNTDSQTVDQFNPQLEQNDKGGNGKDVSRSDDRPNNPS
jgi:tetratricopeptide (TPR) repeat protein